MVSGAHVVITAAIMWLVGHCGGVHCFDCGCFSLLVAHTRIQKLKKKTEMKKYCFFVKQKIIEKRGSCLTWLNCVHFDT